MGQRSTLTTPGTRLARATSTGGSYPEQPLQDGRPVCPAGAGDSVQPSISPSLHPIVLLPACPPDHPPPPIHPPTPSSLTCPSAHPPAHPHPKGHLVRARPRAGPGGHDRPFFHCGHSRRRRGQVHLCLRELKGWKPTRAPASRGRVAGTTAPPCSGLRRSVERCQAVTRLTSACCVLVTGQAPRWALGGVLRAGGGRSVDSGRAGPGRVLGEVCWPRLRDAVSVRAGSLGCDPLSASLPSCPQPESRRSPHAGAGGSPPPSRSWGTSSARGAGAGPAALGRRRRVPASRVKKPIFPLLLRGAACSSDRTFPDG